MNSSLRPATRIGGRVARTIRSIARAVLRRDADHVRFQGSLLPARSMRFNGPDQQNDEFYLRSALSEAQRVLGPLALQPDELVVDVGCGQGRMAIGLARLRPRARYIGVDVSGPSIAWCKRRIESAHPTFHFQHLDLVNARYNPSGAAMPSDFRLPIDDASAAIVYLWGVVTNMEPEFLPAYVREVDRVLRPGGRLFITANVEADVPDVSINPPDYVSFRYSGPLHIVRYEKSYLIGLFTARALELTGFAHHAAGNCQSELYFRKP